MVAIDASAADTTTADIDVVDMAAVDMIRAGPYDDVKEKTEVVESMFC